MLKSRSLSHEQLFGTKNEPQNICQGALVMASHSNIPQYVIWKSDLQLVWSHSFPSPTLLVPWSTMTNLLDPHTFHILFGPIVLFHVYFWSLICVLSNLLVSYFPLSNLLVPCFPLPTCWSHMLTCRICWSHIRPCPICLVP